jgi:hypothetical protein
MKKIITGWKGMLVIAFILGLTSAASAVPSKFSFQAVLRDENNVLLQGTKNVKAEIMNAQNQKIWEENFEVPFTNGSFKVELGKTQSNPITVAMLKQDGLEMQFTVNNKTVPRMPFLTYPYSTLSSEALAVDWTNVQNKPTISSYTAGTGLSLTSTTFKVDSTVVTRNYAGTVTANYFAGDGSRLTNLPTGTLSDSSVTTAKLNNGAVTAAKIASGTITSANISTSAAIPFSKLNIVKSDITALGIPGADTDTTYTAGTGLSLTGTTFKVASTVVTSNYTGTITATAFVGDGSGLTNLATATLSDNSVTSAKIANGTITSADISTSAAIPFSKLTIVKSDITALGIPGADTDTTYTAGTGLSLTGTTFKVASTVVTSNYAGTVTANYFAGDGSRLTNLPTATLTDNSVTTAKLNNGAVTSAKIANGTITSANISTSAAIPFSKLSISKADITGLGIPGSTSSADVVTKNYAGTVTVNSLVTNTLKPTGINRLTITGNDQEVLRVKGLHTNFAKIALESKTGAGTQLSFVENDVQKAIVGYRPGTGMMHFSSDQTDILNVDVANQRVGIGNANPQSMFSVGPENTFQVNVMGSIVSAADALFTGVVTANSFAGDGSRLTNLPTATLSDNSVTSAKIANGTITSADISASAAIPFSRLSIVKSDITALGIPGSDTDTTYTAGTGLSLTSTTFKIDSTVVTRNYAGTVTANYFAGDGSRLTNIAATSVADSSITSAKIANDTITNADINSAAGIAFSKLTIAKSDITALGIPGADTDTTYTAGIGLSLTGTTFKIDSTVVTRNYAGTVTANKFVAATGKFTGTVTANAFVGDGSRLTNLAASGVTDNAITSAKITNDTITNADINSAAGIAFSKLTIVKSDITGLGIPGSDTDTTYTAGTGLSLTSTTFKIDSTVVTRNYAGTVTANQFAAATGKFTGTVTANAFVGDGSRLTNLAASGVTDNAITSAKIANDSIVNADINSSAAIAYSKLNLSNSIVAGDITAGAVGYTKVSSAIVTSNYNGTVTATAFSGTIVATQVAQTGLTAATSIDWRTSSRQKVTFNNSTSITPTFTFSNAPLYPGSLMLIIAYSGTAAVAPTWPGTVKWPDGVAPSLSANSTKVDVVSFYYDGTNYLGVSTTGFQ